MKLGVRSWEAAAAAAAVFFVSACSGGADRVAPATPCDGLAACCDALPGAAGPACRTQLGEAQSTTDPSAACNALLSGYAASGLCNAGAMNSNDNSAPDSGVADVSPPPNGLDSGPPSGQPAVCARYVSCWTLTNPGATAAVLAAYGPGGSCWQTTPQVAADCTTACERSLAQLHMTYPQEPSCAQCASDGECSGATPACSAGGTCVACNADKYCGGTTPACSVGAGACVECTRDVNCTDPLRPHCDLTSDTCAACTDGSQCTSGVCQTGGTCCVRKTACYSGFNCGVDDDGCGGQLPCGTCSVGSCLNNACNTVGQNCTPNVTPCAPGERCMFDAWHQAYKCAPTTPNFTCQQDQDCETVYDSSNQPVEPYVCSNGSCYQACLQTSDCPSGTCQVVIGSITPMTPGMCN
jgi:hypothetical protein